MIFYQKLKIYFKINSSERGDDSAEFEFNRTNRAKTDNDDVVRKQSASKSPIRNASPKQEEKK